VQKIPGGPKVQVFVGTSVLLTLCAIPVLAKDQKRGHDLFSQEKPEAVQESQEKAIKAFDNKAIQRRREGQQ
jgi:hypothetical protein